jgi:transcriptional regulator with XRE-family HTH domain
LYDLGLVRARNKNKAHSLCLELFKESGFSKADLAKMLGKKPEQITRWLAGPGNITLDTLSDLIFALKGEFFVVQCKDDLSCAKSNRTSPELWHSSGEELSIVASKWEAVCSPCSNAERSMTRKLQNSFSAKYSFKFENKDGEKYKTA